MKKSTTIASTITVIFFSFVFIYSAVRFSQNRSTTGVDAARINELVSEKKAIEYSLETAESKIQQSSVTGSGVFILFDRYTDSIESHVLPILEKMDYTAILCCSPEESEFDVIKKLTDEKSWELAASLSEVISHQSSEKANTKAIDEYLESFKVKPQIACISAEDYLTSYDELMTKHGISTLIIKDGNTTYNYFSYECDLIKISDLKFSVTHTIEKALKKRITSGIPTVISIKEVEENSSDISPDSISVEKFSLMVNALESYGNLTKIGQLVRYSDESIENLNKMRKTVDDLILKISEYEKRLQEIDAEISAILSQS